MNAAFVMVEGTRAYPDVKPIGGLREDATRREDAEHGSAMLRDAILVAKGYPPPRRKPRAQVPIVPRHEPTCCEACGCPFKPEPRLISNIQATVASYFRINPITMCSARRQVAICHPRQIAMYLASELTPKSLPVIGQQFGGRDHTTVMHAIRAVKRRMEDDPEVALDVEALRLRLAEAA